jgi:hypothetical protein
VNPPRKPPDHDTPGQEQAGHPEGTAPAPRPAPPPAKPAAKPPVQPPAEPPAAAVASPGFVNPDSGQIGRGKSGSGDGPECPVCYASGGGAHGSHCPNAGLPPEQWVTEPQAGWTRPDRGA